MFNLIVKDPRRKPPQRTAWIGESQPCCGPRTRCAAFLRELFKTIDYRLACQAENRFSFRFLCGASDSLEGSIRRSSRSARALISSPCNANLLNIALRADICWRSRAVCPHINARSLTPLSCIWIVRSSNALSSACRTPGSPLSCLAQRRRIR